MGEGNEVDEGVRGEEPSNAPAAAERGSASPAAPASPLVEEGNEVDWNLEDSEVSRVVKVASAERDFMKEELPAEEAALSERRAESLEVGAALGGLPGFLNSERGQGMPRSEDLARVRIMKAKG